MAANLISWNLSNKVGQLSLNALFSKKLSECFLEARGSLVTEITIYPTMSSKFKVVSRFSLNEPTQFIERNPTLYLDREKERMPSCVALVSNSLYTIDNPKYNPWMEG